MCLYAFNLQLRSQRDVGGEDKHVKETPTLPGPGINTGWSAGDLTHFLHGVDRSVTELLGEHLASCWGSLPPLSLLPYSGSVLAALC